MALPPPKETNTRLMLALITMASVTGVYAAIGMPENDFGEYCFALLGAAGIYSTARVAEKFVPRRGGK